MPRAHPHFSTSLIFLKWTSLSWMLPQGLLNSKQKYPCLSRVSTGYLENVIYTNVPMVYSLCPEFQLQRTVHSRLLDMVVQSLCNWMTEQNFILYPCSAHVLTSRVVAALHNTDWYKPQMGHLNQVFTKTTPSPISMTFCSYYLTYISFLFIPNYFYPLAHWCFWCLPMSLL